MAIQLGAPHGISDVQQAFIQIVDIADELKRRCEAIGQWASLFDAPTLAGMWNIAEADAQMFLDAAHSFGMVIDNALTADDHLGPNVARIRNVAK